MTGLDPKEVGIGAVLDVLADSAHEVIAQMTTGVKYVQGIKPPKSDEPTFGGFINGANWFLNIFLTGRITYGPT